MGTLQHQVPCSAFVSGLISFLLFSEKNKAMTCQCVVIDATQTQRGMLHYHKGAPNPNSFQGLKLPLRSQIYLIIIWASFDVTLRRNEVDAAVVPTLTGSTQ